MQCLCVCSCVYKSLCLATFFSWLVCVCAQFVKIQHCDLSQYRLNYSQSNIEQSAILYLVCNYDFKHVCINGDSIKFAH